MTERQRVSIRSARDLLAALEGDDGALRTATLEMVLRNPAAAWRYGSHGGRDVIDALLAIHGRVTGWSARRVVMQALMAFGDPRVVQFCATIVQQRGRRESLELAAARIGAEPPEVARELLRGILMQDGWPVHAAVAATVLERSPLLSVHERIRVACAIGHGTAELPAFETTSIEAWLRELNGPFQDGAHAVLERLGVNAFRALRSVWSRMTTPVAVWFLEWGLRSLADETMGCLEQALRSPDDELAVPALLALARHPSASPRIRPLLQRFIRHSDPAVRRATLSLGATDVPWTDVAQHDSDTRARVIAIRQLAAERAPEHLLLYVSLMQEENWRVRAAATGALTAIGDAAVESAKRLALDSRPEVRVAAVQTLLSLGQHEWLEASLIPA